MNILSEIFGKSKKLYAFLALIALINSVLNTCILMFINSYCTKSTLFIPQKYLGIIFLTMLITSFFLNRSFRAFLIRTTNELLISYELTMLNKLRRATYESYEWLGKEKVYAAIEDARFLGRIPEVFVFSFNSIVVILCCLVFLFIKSFVGGVIILGFVLLMGIYFAYKARFVRIQMEQLRDLLEAYLKNINDLLHGFKEIKMSAKKNENLFNNYIKKNRLEWKALGVDTGIKFNNNEITGNFTWYIVIGIIMFIFPALIGFTAEMGTAFIIITLYLMTPVAYLIVTIRDVNNVRIATDRLQEFDKLLNSEIKTESYIHFSPMAQKFEKLEFKDLYYKYNHNDKDEGFHLGPVNLTFKKGEVTFITGGNGSGKSTFINLLTGLYKPQRGNIYLNGEPVSIENYEQYISRFSAIFTDHHLFNHNYEEIDFEKKSLVVKDYLKKMKIADIVRFKKEDNIFDNKLSKGQQKRLALIYALMEERDILVLDEWAAEQDPQFKAYFYRHLINEIKDSDKTIIAITHDDAYFDCADKIIKFEGGKIVRVETTHALSLKTQPMDSSLFTTERLPK